MSGKGSKKVACFETMDRAAVLSADASLGLERQKDERAVCLTTDGTTSRWRAQAALHSAVW